MVNDDHYNKDIHGKFDDNVLMKMAIYQKPNNQSKSKSKPIYQNNIIHGYIELIIITISFHPSIHPSIISWPSFFFFH